MEFTPHPICEIFPPLAEQEYRELVESIRTNGQLVPILVWNDEIIDGRHRARACDELEIEVQYRRFEGDRLAANLAALGANIRRRHLTTSQRAAIAAEAMPAIQEATRERMSQVAKGLANLPTPQTAATELAPIVGRDVAAIALNVSPRTVQDAEAVRRADPALHERVKAGEIPAYKAAQQVRQRHSPPPEAPPGETHDQRLVREAMTCLHGAEEVWKAFDKLRREAIALRTSLTGALGMHPAFAKYMDGRAALDALARAAEIVGNARPYWACPGCGGSREQRDTCRVCAGAGWVSKHVWECTDPALREAMPVKPKNGTLK